MNYTVCKFSQSQSRLHFNEASCPVKGCSWLIFIRNNVTSLHQPWNSNGKTNKIQVWFIQLLNCNLIWCYINCTWNITLSMSTGIHCFIFFLGGAFFFLFLVCFSVVSSSDSILVSEASLSLSTTARFLPATLLPPAGAVFKDAEEEDCGADGVVVVVLTFVSSVSGCGHVTWSRGSRVGVMARGRGTGNSLSSSVGTRDWSKSWSTLQNTKIYEWVIHNLYN